MASDPAVYVGKRKEVGYEIRAVEYNGYVGGRSGTLAVQLGLQQLVFVGERLVRQQKFVVQLSSFGRASLERGNVSVIYEDSRRVIFTRPSFNYSIRISGTGDNGYLLQKG